MDVKIPLKKSIKIPFEIDHNTLLEMNIEILQLICLEYILNLSQINLPPISRKSKFCSNDGLNSSQNKDENYFGMSTKILFKLSVKILSNMNINFLIEMNFESLPEMISDFSRNK